MRTLGVDCANVIFYPWRNESVLDSVESLRILKSSGIFENIYLISRANPLTQLYYRFRLRRMNIWSLSGIPENHLYFCWRNDQKAAICKTLGVTDFIDDSPRVLQNMDGSVQLFAFNPTKENAIKYPEVLSRAHTVKTWKELLSAFVPS